MTTTPQAHEHVLHAAPGLTVYACGCRALSDHDRRVPPKLEWCALHAAAPKMLAALERAVDFYVAPPTQIEAFSKAQATVVKVARAAIEATQQ